MAASEPDPWTFVKPRSRKGKGKQSSIKPPPGAQVSASAPADIKPRTSDLRSVDEIDAEYRSVREQWLGSECCVKLRELVKKHAYDSTVISKAVCLGVGTFDPEDGAWAQKRISYHQLIAFTVMVEELENITGTKVECISQDPIFTESDKAFLTKLGHTVLESPAAYSEIDEDTFLYGVHLYRPVYAASVEKSLPQIFVGTGYDEWEGATMGSLDDIKPMKKMDEEYKKTVFPEDAITATFFGTSIYWRPNSNSTPEQASKPLNDSDTASNTNTEANIEDNLSERLAATKIT